jgi:hypothetical protein
MLAIWTADNDRSRIAGTRVPSALDASGPHRARNFSSVYVTHSLALPRRRASIMIRPAEDRELARPSG